MTDPSNPYGIQVVVTPGRLSSTAHLLHVVISFFTCGLWLPIYALIVLTASPKRVQVMAPAGTPQAWIDDAYARASALTPEETVQRNRNYLVFGIIGGGLFLLCFGAWAFSLFTN